jgi:hypothetical protein
MTYVIRLAVAALLIVLAPAVLACDPATLDESMVKCFAPPWTEMVMWRERLLRYADVENQHRMKGLASYYSGFFDGRKTANGEIFRNKRLSAAHLTLPFGTVVEIRSRATGKKIRLRVNDRGPYVKKFAIDLSQAAARALGVDLARDRYVEVSIVALPGDEPVPDEFHCGPEDDAGRSPLAVR